MNGDPFGHPDASSVQSQESVILNRPQSNWKSFGLTGGEDSSRPGGGIVVLGSAGAAAAAVVVGGGGAPQDASYVDSGDGGDDDADGLAVAKDALLGWSATEGDCVLAYAPIGDSGAFLTTSRSPSVEYSLDVPENNRRPRSNTGAVLDFRTYSHLSSYSSVHCPC